MTADPLPRRHAQYAVEWMDNESLIYGSTSKLAIYLNETATMIWKLCDGTRTVKQIVDLLSNSFPEATSDVKADVKETIDELVRKGALQIKSVEQRERHGDAAASDRPSGVRKLDFDTLE